MSIEEKRELLVDQIRKLSDKRQTALDRGIKFIFLTNSGGAVSYLAFLGTSQEMRDIQANYYVLICFIVSRKARA